MSLHIAAEVGEIAETVLLPGDPLRAKFIAENMLKDALCYNEIRGMLGFTGTYEGQRVSVQGTGMGVPSISIYVNELLTNYKVQNLVRVGSCGGIQPEIGLRDIVLAMSASSDSSLNKMRFNGLAFAPTADFTLLKRAEHIASVRGIHAKVGSILTSDHFYYDDPDFWKLWAGYGVLAIEMETAALYTLASKFRAQALSILTVSDDLVRGEAVPPAERETAFTQMMQIALETVTTPPE